MVYNYDNLTADDDNYEILPEWLQYMFVRNSIKCWQLLRIQKTNPIGTKCCKFSKTFASI